MISLQKTGKWWVLAVGDKFGEAGFEGRDLCRAELLHQVHGAGIRLDENVWVFDEDERAQLVLRTCDTRERAEAVAGELSATGLTLKVSKEFE